MKKQFIKLMGVVLAASVITAGSCCGILAAQPEAGDVCAGEADAEEVFTADEASEEDEELNGAEEVEVDGFTYSVENGIARIKKYNGSATEVEVPSKVTISGSSYTLNTIMGGAFENNTTLKKVVLPKSITELGKCAFKNCTSLESITINGNLGNADPNSANSDGGNFSWGYINNSIFMNAGKNASSLKVVFGDEVTAVPNHLFATGGNISDNTHACVTEVVFGKNVTSIGSYAFINCYKLSKITLGSGVEKIYDHAFANDVELGELEFPERVASIGKNAFLSCSGVKSIHIKGNTAVGVGAFMNDTALENLTFDGNGSMGATAFANCTSLKSVAINGNLAAANQNSAFGEGGNYSWSYPNNSVFLNAGKNASDLTVTFGGEASVVPDYLFATNGTVSDGTHARVKKVVLGDNITAIGPGCFYKCYDLATVTFDDKLTTIGSNAFGYDTSLAVPAFTSAITTLDERAFVGCTAFDKLTIPRNITRINKEAFMACTGLTDITINSNIALGARAFVDCTAVKNITLNGHGSLGVCAFANTRALENLNINGNYKDCSSNSKGEGGNWSWSYTTNSVFLNAGKDSGRLKISFKEGVTVVPAYIFATGASVSDGDYVHVKEVYLPVSLKSIGEYAFFNCHDLNALTFGGTSDRFAEISASEGNDFSKLEPVFEKKKYNPKDWKDVDPDNPGDDPINNDDPVTTTSGNVIVSKEGETVTVIEGDTVTLKITGVDNKTVIAKGKAGTYANGVVKTVKKGTVTLFKTDGKKKTKICKIKVLSPKIKKSLKLKTGKSKKLKLSGAKGVVVEKWTSSNPKVVKVDAQGTLEAVASGSAEVTAYVGTHKYTCAVTVP